MSDRVALVAGVNGALGRATAAALAGAGFTVAGIDRSALPDGIRGEVGDPVDPAVAKALVDRIAADVGAPDVLVNTIGAFSVGDALATTPEDLHAMLDANLGAALWLSQAVGTHMRQRGSGAIVHVGGKPGLEPTPGLAAYSVSKAALAHLTRLLDVELRPHGIRVNAVVPELLDTARNRRFLPPEQLARAVPVEAIAEIITFLAGDAAAPVSGALLPAYGA